MGKRKYSSSLGWFARVAAGLGLGVALTGQVLAGGSSHVHGEATLLVVLEGNALDITLQSPAANIVGFEHLASTPEQIRSVQSARVALESPALFAFIGTRCVLNQAAVDMTALMLPADRDPQQAVAQGRSSNSGHSVVRADYRFDCSDGPGLRAISADFLRHSFVIGKLHVQWITDTHQGAAALTASARTIELR